MANNLFSKIGRMFDSSASTDAHAGHSESSMDSGNFVDSTSVISSVNLSATRAHRFSSVLRANSVDLKALRDLLWSGCPLSDRTYRSVSWKLVVGYFPSRKDRFDEVVLRKRGEYIALLPDYSRVSGVLPESSVDEAASLLRQIRLDIPRTCFNSVTSFSHSRVQRLMERALFLLSYRNPACGYVQGMNDLAIPLLVALLEEHEKGDIADIHMESVSESTLRAVEADLYWMMSKLLQDLQENYIFSQPGIQKLNLKLKDIVQRVDPDLSSHLLDEQVELMQISFRWFNCLLTREFNIKGILRVWDTCIAEEEGFSVFLVYLCAVMLTKLSVEMKKLDFQGIMMLMSKLPFTSYEVADIETLLSEAFVLKSLFHSSPNHLVSPSLSN